MDIGNEREPLCMDQGSWNDLLQDKLDEIQTLEELQAEVNQSAKMHLKIRRRLRAERDQLQAERDQLREQYSDLIMMVDYKTPDESRHDTAKRWLQEHIKARAICSAKALQGKSHD